MAQQSTDYLSAVKDVISVCKDAHEGFHGAANAVKRTTAQKNIRRVFAATRTVPRELESGGQPYRRGSLNPIGLCRQAA